MAATKAPAKAAAKTSATKKAKPATTEFGVAIVLHHTGGPLRHEVPARDLTAADIEYAARVAALKKSGGISGAHSKADREALTADLVASGAFSKAPPVKVESTPAPAQPAEEKPA